MHHGPILTLFDVTSIILNYMLIKGMKITTFSVANKVSKNISNIEYKL